MQNLTIGTKPIPTKKRVGRPSQPNPFLAYVSDLIGTENSHYVVIDGTADPKSNPDLRSLIGLLNRAGKALNVTVKKSVDATEDGSGVEVAFWPVTRRVQKPKADAPVTEPTEPAVVDAPAADAEPSTDAAPVAADDDFDEDGLFEDDDADALEPTPKSPYEV